MQLGIGAISDSVLASFKDSKGLCIWTEIFSDGVLDLYKMGVLDPDILLTASFILRPNELYECLHLNRRVQILRTERTNDPSSIAKQAQILLTHAAHPLARKERLSLATELK